MWNATIAISKNDKNYGIINSKHSCHVALFRLNLREHKWWLPLWLVFTRYLKQKSTKLFVFNACFRQVQVNKEWPKVWKSGTGENYSFLITKWQIIFYSVWFQLHHWNRSEAWLVLVLTRFVEEHPTDLLFGLQLLVIKPYTYGNAKVTNYESEFYVCSLIRNSFKEEKIWAF